MLQGRAPPNPEPPLNTSILGVCALALTATVTAPALADDAAPGYVPPHVADYTGGAIPANAHLENRTDRTLLSTGAALAAIPYGFSVLYALSTCGAQMDCRSGSQWLYMPVLGPFLTAAQAPTSGGEALSVFDGALQLTGLGFLVASQLLPRKVVVWQDTAFQVLPAVVPGGAGLSLSVTSM